MAPTHVLEARGRSIRVALAAAASAAALLLSPATATADHRHHGSATPAPVDHSAHASHAAEADHSAHASQAAAADLSAQTSQPAARAVPAGWEISTPTNPRVTKGPRGPLWSSSRPKTVGSDSMGLTFAQRYVATRLEAARRADELRATRSALTQSQATKKLSKKCQRLVKITKAKQLKKLKKADKKARTKCLEQRRRIIADSKKKPTGGATTPGTTTPSTGGTTSPGGGTPNPGSGTTNPGGGTTNPGGGTTDPKPTPDDPKPTTPACTPHTGPVHVTAISDSGAFSINFDAVNCSLKAGSHLFELANADDAEEHNLVIANKLRASGQSDGVPVARISDVLQPGDGPQSKTVSLAPGVYYFVCEVEGHGAMTLKFTVVA